jgi:iclR helix-turn-helix domain superfamily protein|nr:MAG TPA: EPS-associated transcriptional regulator, MarR family [Caudoviricetes sp.]DAO65926.1 MAG TPA: EPS-associated transcriptional regulator, MarR family [Caudoviricetes sp.]
MATSKKGSRILRVYKALEAHPIIGISNKELAEGLGISAVHVSRDLEDLIAEGLVAKLDNGNFAYSIKTLQIAERFRKQQERLQSRIAEIGRRVEID